MLTKALQTQGAYTIEPIEKPSAKPSDLMKETGFICHISNHWFTIRKVATRWFNLNSLEKEPIVIPDSELAYSPSPHLQLPPRLY